MKPRISILLTAIVLSIIAVSCVTKNPAYTAGNTNGVPQYVVDPRLAATSNTVQGVTAVVAPAAGPWGSLVEVGVTGVFGLITAISAAVATAKNRGKVIDTMAAGIVKAGGSAPQVVLDHASEHGTYAAVADAINSNTGANQGVTGASKTP